MRRIFSNLAIARKIAIVSGTILAIFLVAVAITLVKMGDARAQFASAEADRGLISAAEKIAKEQLVQRSTQAEFFVYKDEALLEEFEASAGRADVDRKALIAQFPDNAVIQKAVSLAAEFDAKHDAAVFDKIAPAVTAGRLEDARAAEEEAKGWILKQIEQGQIVVAEVKRVADEQQESAESALAQTRTTLIVLAAGALVAGLLLSFALIRVLARPLRGLERSLADIADGDGDLTQRVDDSRRDEIGAVGRAFNRFATQIQDIVREVQQAAAHQARTAREMAGASDQTGAAVGQIAATVEDVARGSSEQAAGTQTATAKIQEMAQGVTRIAEGGESAAAVALEADEVASRGAEVIAQATRAMGSIEQRVEDAAGVVDGLGARGEAIGAIVNTIDQIASQTNLLALNAAIEAARAGEQGRGFAVVAEEVRQLAEESQKAAASISEIIGDLQQETKRAVEAMRAGREEVVAGVGQVAGAGEAFGSIREQVARLSEEVESVAATARQVATETGEVEDQIAGVAAVSEENAAAAQEVAASTEETGASTQQVAAAAQSLAADADKLAHLVARFRV
jgi:methyl-accepting chemotaxis protein